MFDRFALVCTMLHLARSDGPVEAKPTGPIPRRAPTTRRRSGGDAASGMNHQSARAARRNTDADAPRTPQSVQAERAG